MTESISDIFHDIDQAFCDGLGLKKVEEVMADLHNPKLSLRQVAEKNGLYTSAVVQIARYRKVDPVTMRKTP